jgi:tetratricopeptide (TPR) repeat protein
MITTHKILFITLSLIIVMASAISATNENGAEFEIIIRQKPVEIEKYFEITRDTVKALVGKSLSILIVNLVMDIDVERADSQSVDFSVHMVTFGPSPFNQAKTFRVEMGLPARIENIPGKNGSSYQILISPRQLIQIDTANCTFDPSISGVFQFDPSANFDLYYVKGTLADFHWNTIKSYLETDYEQFQKALNLATTGKINFFLCPCAIPSINWDKRFGYMIDPGRSDIYAIYAHEFASVDPILPNMLRLLQLWGYAPPFLVEGIAGYFDFANYEIKKARLSKKLPGIASLLTASGYYACEPKLAETVAASFIKYLADSYGISKIKQIYEKSDDLTLQMNLEKAYALPLDSLEKYWNKYIDTVTVLRRHYDFYGARAGAIYNASKQIEYYEEMAKLDSTNRDSINTWEKLAPLYYQYGHYYKAVEAYQRLIKIDSVLPVYYQILGNLLLYDGKYDAAMKTLDTVYMLDSEYATSHLLQAKILAIRGDTLEAIKLAGEYYPVEKSNVGKVEFLLFLGKMYGQKGKNYDSAMANQYFSDAYAWAADIVSKAADDPAHKLRAGLACLGLREFDKAENYLEIASFTEFRSLFIGEVLIAFGNLYDLRGNHEKAMEYYRKCLTYPLAVYQHDLCNKYIDTPYKN